MSKRSLRAKPKPTTGIDNVLIHNLHLFNRYIEPVQIDLPYRGSAISKGAFTMHDWWVIVALLFYLNLDDPSGVHRIESTSEVLSLMRYTKIVADASDPASLDAMAARAKVILTTVGPYQLYGAPLVAACVLTLAPMAPSSH